MYLAVTQLQNNDTISTTMRVEKSMTVRYIRLSLYKNDTPDGTLAITFKDGTTTIGTSSLDLNTLTTEVGSYYHGYVRFDIGQAGMRINLKGTDTYKELNIEISLTGHTDDGANYIALNKFFEGQFVDSYGSIPIQTTEQATHSQPYTIELYEV